MYSVLIATIALQRFDFPLVQLDPCSSPRAMLPPGSESRDPLILKDQEDQNSDSTMGETDFEDMRPVRMPYSNRGMAIAGLAGSSSYTKPVSLVPSSISTPKAAGTKKRADVEDELFKEVVISTRSKPSPAPSPKTTGTASRQGRFFAEETDVETATSADSSFDLIESIAAADLVTTKNDKPATESTGCTGCIQEQYTIFYNNILFPDDFVLFNVICVLQSIPALGYYILFFLPDHYLYDTAGMAPVWGATMGAISAVLVTSALLPVPEFLITRSICIAVIMLQFTLSLSCGCACVFLWFMKDYHGFLWTGIGSISTFICGRYLYWLGRYVEHMGKCAAQAERKKEGRKDDTKSLVLPTIYDNSNSDGTETIQAEIDLESNDNSESEVQPSAAIGCIIGIVQVLLWLVIIVFFIIPLGFGANTAWIYFESQEYTAPGKVYGIPLGINGSKGSVLLPYHLGNEDIPMHIHCIGNKTVDRPVMVLEADLVRGM